MRVLLLMPDGHVHKIKLGPFERSMREAPLTLTLLASMAPEHLDISFTLADESVEPVPYMQEFDLVAISVITGTSIRGYRWAAYFRDSGIPVVIGGVHATLLPDEVSKHADYVIAGPAESSWPKFLEDFSQGRAKSMYRETNYEPSLLQTWPMPHRHLQSNARYNLPYTVAATRGCRHACSFCSVPYVWKGYAKRPVGKVIDEVRKCPGKLLAFNDVSLVDDVEFAKELFQAMIPLNKRWGGLATVKLGKSPELVELMAKSGCRYLLVGFESMSQTTLSGMRKDFNREQQYKAFIELLHANGISVQGCFVFGFDQDGPDVFAQTFEKVQELKIDIPRYALLTPYPGTPLYQELDSAGRILTYDWSNYDTMHVVFEPHLMTPDQLYAGFKWAYRETFRVMPILSRLRSVEFSSLINLVGNMTYRRFVRKLYTHQRFAKPFSDLECLGRNIPDWVG